MKRKEIIAVLGITVALTLTIVGVKGYNSQNKNEAQAATANVGDDVSATTEESVAEVSSVVEKEVAVEEQDNSKEENAADQTKVATDTDKDHGENQSEDKKAEEETVNEVAESEKAVVDDAESQTSAPDYTIEKMDETTMYATQTCNLREGPSTDYNRVGQLQTNEEVVVNGKVQSPSGKSWYVLKTEDNSTKMVSSSLLSTSKVSTSQAKSGSSNSNSSNNNNSGNTAAQPAPSDCMAVSSDCEGDCSIEGVTDLGDCCLECHVCYIDAE